MVKQIETAEIIQAIAMRTISVKVVGTTPLIMHRFSAKARQELLYPSGRKNASERASSMKHNPLEEYQGCFYRNFDDETPTLFHLANGMFHGAIASAALDIPGATKSALSRLTKVGSQIDLFGVPRLRMDMVRSSDMNRTPDVRTRPCFPEWACTVSITYKHNPLTDSQILNLLGAAGEIVGIGDWRPQKGGDNGCFRVVSDDDAEWAEIVAHGGRAAQQTAYDRPEEFDEDTAELLAWFNAEVGRRRQSDDDGAKKATRRSKVNGHAESEAVQ